MPRSVARYLRDLRDASDEILMFTEGMCRSDYAGNLLVRRAVERDFIIIGDALAQMRIHHLDFMKHIEESQKIVAFRNVLVHEYSTVDNDDVWSAITSKLPPFRKQILAVIAALDAGTLS
jgi:uncharacterized protein with HEPN domain